MSTEDFKLDSFDGLKLFCRTWFPPTSTPTKARIVFLHGFSEFVDAYDDWFPLVTSGGYEVTSYDQRGHGNTAASVSRKEFGKSNEAGIMGDIETVLNYVIEKNTNEKLPIILWGFSMGGANCLNYMVIGEKKDKIDLYISGGPYLETHPDTNKGLNAVKLWAVPLLAKIYPGYTDAAELKPEISTNDPEKWDLYRKQPLRHTKMTVEFISDALKRGKRLQDPQFLTGIAQKPLLLCHGLSDQICDVDATKHFFRIAPLEDKTLDLYPGLPHELMHCVKKDQDEHWRRVSEWLHGHLDKTVESNSK